MGWKGRIRWGPRPLTCFPLQPEVCPLQVPPCSILPTVTGFRLEPLELFARKGAVAAVRTVWHPVKGSLVAVARVLAPLADVARCTASPFAVLFQVVQVVLGTYSLSSPGSGLIWGPSASHCSRP